MKRLLFALLVFAHPALATPPDFVSINDRVFGVDMTRLWILREMRDNLGMHAYGLHDIHLVAKNLTNGEEEIIGPVARIVGWPERDGSEPVLHLDMPNPVNPYAFLAENNGLPFAYEFVPIQGGGIDADGLTVDGNWISRADLLAQIGRSVRLVADATQPYPDDVFPKMSHSTPAEMLGGMRLDLAYCTATGWIRFGVDYSKPEPLLVRLRCDDDDGITPIQVIVVMPPE